MKTSRILGCSAFVIAAAACAPKPVTNAQAPTLKPREGPSASVYVNYMGGRIDRRLNATFSVDEDAYVLVGHLGGDGTLEVLFPESPRSRGRVEADTRLRTGQVEAYRDGMPPLFYTMSANRRSGALMDSYDGRGMGYVFIVASHRPLDFDRFEVDGEWDDLYVANFAASADPRWAVHDFAEVLTNGGGDYTLKFASSSQSQYVNMFASRAWDCSLHRPLGYTPLAYSYFFGPVLGWHSYYNSFGYGHGFGSYCGGGDYWMSYDRMRRLNRRPIIIAWTPVVPVTPPRVGTPATPTTPEVTRQGRRPHGDRALSLDRVALGPEESPRATLTNLPDRPHEPRRGRRVSDDSRGFDDDRSVRDRRSADAPSRRVRDTERSRPATPRAAPRRPTTERARPASQPTRTSRPTAPRKPKPDSQ